MNQKYVSKFGDLNETVFYHFQMAKHTVSLKSPALYVELFLKNLMKFLMMFLQSQGYITVVQKIKLVLQLFV
jgi:hypothetical protein